MPGPGQKTRHRADIEQPAAVTCEAVDKGQRQFGQARTLRSIICNCSSRSSALASPTRPKPALLTTNCGSAPCAASASPITPRDPGLQQIGRNDNRPRPPVAAISSASARNLSSLRATSTNSCPSRANTRASAAPIPAEAPVITVTGRRLLILVGYPHAIGRPIWAADRKILR